MLKLRVITAVVLLFIVLGALFGLGRSAFAITAAVFFLAAGWEWSAWISNQWDTTKRAIWLGVAGLLMWAVETWQWHKLILLMPFVWLLFLYWVIRFPDNKAWFQSHVMAGLGLLVLVPAWASVVHIKDTGAFGLTGPWALLFILLWVWAADVGAYFSGRQWGKKKLAPSVSPGKTIEGLLGGLVLALLVNVVVFLVTDLDVGLFSLLIVATVTVLTSVLGDLFESMVKRSCQVKDSGTMLPGHGGMLDRIDSVTAALPMVVALLSLFSIHGGL